MSTPSARRVESPARFYEDYLVPSLFRPFAEELIERAAPQPGERVLDVACGTGIVARLAARRMGAGARIVGLDLSPAMLEVASEVVAGEDAQFEWVAGDAQALPFPDESFDLVLCQQGLQPLPDRVAALREMRRVLAPGGRLLTSTWTAIEHHPVDKMMAESVERHLGAPAFHAPFSLGDHDLLRELFREAGFGEVELEVVVRELRFPSADEYVERIVIGGIAAIPGFQNLDVETGERLIAAICADIAPTVAQYTVDGALVMPWASTTIASARKEGPA